jgi:hypothetical protein
VEDFDNYYAYDDDRKRNTYSRADLGQSVLEKERLCRRPRWYRETRINCNTLHEVNIAGLYGHGNLDFVG